VTGRQAWVRHRPSASRSVLVGLRWGLLALLLFLVAVIALLLTNGWALAVDYSDSMRPAVRAGDLLVSSPITAEHLHPGDVVTFPDAQRPGRTLTHRVLTVAPDSAGFIVTTRGDANADGERWKATAGRRLLRLRADIPKLGYVLAPFRTATGRLGGVLLLLGLAVAVVRPRVKSAPDVPTERS
jgi:signal peptidase I